MKIEIAQNLACPIDGKLLVSTENQLVCPLGHSYDIAKQGYINLLPVQYKRSKQPGDSKEMVVARSRFFESGLYEPIAEQLSTIVQENTRRETTLNILDVGCGEGYYLNYLSGSLMAIPNDNKYALIGLDISKPAILSAAKTNSQVTWLVATNRQPPIEKSSVDIILCVFGFPCYDAFIKVLKPGGMLLLVNAGVDHLMELRKIIYPIMTSRNLTDSLVKKDISTLTSSGQQQLTYQCTLSSNEIIKNLLLMTPHIHRAKKQARDIAMKLEKLAVTIDIKFRILKKV